MINTDDATSMLRRIITTPVDWTKDFDFDWTQVNWRLSKQYCLSHIRLAVRICPVAKCCLCFCKITARVDRVKAKGSGSVLIFRSRVRGGALTASKFSPLYFFFDHVTWSCLIVLYNFLLYLSPIDSQKTNVSCKKVRSNGAVSVLTADVPFRTMLRRIWTATAVSLIQISSVTKSDQFSTDATRCSVQP